MSGQLKVEETDRSIAFREFFRADYGAVLAFSIRRLDDHENAREVAADVFRIAWRDFEPDAPPSRAFLFGVARNLIGDSYRRRDRDRRLLELLREEPWAGGGAQPTDLLVQAVLEQLAPAVREVLTLKYWDGMPAAQMGALLGCSSAAVWVRLHRARQAFAAEWLRHRDMTEKERIG